VSDKPSPATVALPAVTPVPENVTVAPVTKFVPVIVTVWLVAP
jgi:hypothetical protein